ncbi:hypothetical protein Mp_5g17220 [Marchantia polymorpha subsp. ruderalis]|uniref:Expansin-like EG45 domain-containing protein n=2 Tax=Marchantia polymorpha TaxID=3197 RepID=A0AAF6BJ98_MARPO|nr:hypothetical protein MARPO_0196s0002 [Marchantia polymorpha]BBN12082.1 hypothetical protein Mp_5g17220 [Marchantia polymorpha subsp. ruderalis]|eukprot:PTQ27490.1 hypothetical protein MARPO_0196s0002 [Marchantia polymorpha]
MENSGLKRLLCLLITWTTVAHVEANFHMVNERSGSKDVIKLVPSNNFGCAGVETNAAATGQYPSCSGGDIRIPDGQCGWSGVKIRPSCGGNYFGKLYGGSGEPQGDCYWNDSGNFAHFLCGPLVGGGVRAVAYYDRLVCYTAMCGS